MVQALRRALDDFFGSKKSRVPRKLLEGCLSAHPAAAPQLLPDLLARAAAARTPFLRAEALALLAPLLRLPKVRDTVNLRIADAQSACATILQCCKYCVPECDGMTLYLRVL